MKFKVDENLPEELSQLLLGFVTFDRGFANIRAYPPVQTPGMIVFRLKSQDKHHVLKIAERLVVAFSQRQVRNELWIVSENRIRIRSL